MLSLTVRVAVVALVAAMVVVADPSYPYKPQCHPHTVTVTKVESIIKEVPVYKTVHQYKVQTVTSTKTQTETVKVIHSAHHQKHYTYGR